MGEDELWLSGRYRLTRVLGSGGMGRVWHAWDELLAREVAVKELTVPHAERALREARAAARISHPNVVTVFDVVEEDHRLWIVMQLVQARSLAQVVAADGPLDAERAAAIGLDVLHGLRAVHEQGVLHRDVKPGNVLIDGTGSACLTDFGIATFEGDNSLAASGTIVGAPSYIAPERVRAHSTEPASDLWSLGATLYFALEGRAPFDRSDPLSTMTAVLVDEPTPPRHSTPLTPLVLAMLGKDPARRPDEDQVETELRAVAGMSTATVQLSRARSRRAPAALMGVASMAVALVAGLVVLSHQPPAPGPVPQQQGDHPAATSVAPSEVEAPKPAVVNQPPVVQPPASTTTTTTATTRRSSRDTASTSTSTTRSTPSTTTSSVVPETTSSPKPSSSTSTDPATTPEVTPDLTTTTTVTP
ncbi:serine/threonine-protein kinase [Kutzneria albida]|uniref:non-specific serine/threonine protein kinase n=1 Tax=Kutzneria albida DSM 43870 TaxID=1449976 RepID=W5W9W1_9PSEU|nr:serine/threonine-protein kinase [Kutzneria albida]AHH97918.1 hypothetical protein KALB_4556 [Kutzneria albida DSM 43870]